jgi:hypothetical protein
MQEKVQWMEQQARYAIGEEIISKFTCLKFQLLGYTGEGVGAGTQDGNTADLRIFAQGPGKELFDGGDPDGFARKLYETVLQSCPVSTAATVVRDETCLMDGNRVSADRTTCDSRPRSRTGSTFPRSSCSLPAIIESICSSRHQRRM